VGSSVRFPDKKKDITNVLCIVELGFHPDEQLFGIPMEEGSKIYMARLSASSPN
jgi:hypothetical protein